MIETLTKPVMELLERSIDATISETDFSCEELEKLIFYTKKACERVEKATCYEDLYNASIILMNAKMDLLINHKDS